MEELQFKILLDEQTRRIEEKILSAKDEFMRYLGVTREHFEHQLQLVSENLQGVHTRLDTHTEMIAVMKEDIIFIKMDIITLKEDVVVLKHDVKILKTDVKEIKKNLKTKVYYDTFTRFYQSII